MSGSRVIFAIDIESRGQGPASHGIMSIGVCIGSGLEERVFEKQRFDMLPMQGQMMEPRCYDEFWSKNKPQFDALTKNASDAMMQIRKFRELVNRWDSVCPSLYIVADNPAFDIGMINYYLDRASLPTLTYKITDQGKLEYRNVHDADSYGRALLHQGINDQWMSNAALLKVVGPLAAGVDETLHNHMPENDAEFIYRLHLQAMMFASKEGKRP